jgi:hypothetical protein
VKNIHSFDSSRINLDTLTAHELNLLYADTAIRLQKVIGEMAVLRAFINPDPNNLVNMGSYTPEEL